MHGEWLRQPSSATSVIFVHGILSSGDTAWRNAVTGSSWPRLLADDTAADGHGIYVFTYQTNIFSGSYSLGDVVDALKEHLRLDRLLDSERLVFVCHSMGGLAVRKYLVDRSADLVDKGIAVGLYLVASPSLGAEYADWLAPLARLMGHAQAEALRFIKNNQWLADLDKNFKNLRDGERLQIVGKELVEDKFVVLKKFLRTNVVETFAGAVYFGEPFKVPGSDHSSIAKPKDRGEIQHRLLVQFIADVIAKTPPRPRPPAEAPKAEYMPAPAMAGPQTGLLQTPAGTQLFVPLTGTSPLQIVQSVLPRPAFDELFEIVVDADEVPQALFGVGSRKTAALSPHDVEYVKEREGVADSREALQAALVRAGGRLLVVGRGGIGKTREVAELARALSPKRWKVCLAKTGHSTRLGPVAELPVSLLDSRFLFIFDNVHASMLAAAGEPTPYAARLEAFLDDLERLAPGDVNAVAITRDEPRFLQQLRLQAGDTRWGTFSTYRLPEFTAEGLQQILVSLASRAQVQIAPEEVRKLVENSDRKPETLFINVDLAAATRMPLTRSNWLPTEGDSWRQKSLAANARYPLAGRVLEALHLLTTAGMPPRLQYVHAISRALSGEDSTRAIDGLVDEGLLRLRQDFLSAFSPEQFEEEAASTRSLAETLAVIAPMVTEQTATRREWLDDLTYLAGAFGRATQTRQTEEIATLAVERGLETSRIYQLRGSARFILGNLAGAESDLSTAIARDERDANSYVLRGSVRLMLANFSGVIEDMKKALELGRDEGVVYGTLGIAQYRLQQWDDALASLIAAMDKGDPNPFLPFGAGIIRQQAGDYAGAEAYFTAVLERGGLSMSPGLDLLTAIGQGDASQAFAQFDEKVAGSKGADNAMVYGLRAVTRLSAGKFAESELDLTAAIEGGFGASFSRMMSTLGQANVPGALQISQELQGVAAMFSRDAALFQMRSAVRLELGYYDLALEDSKEALERGFEPRHVHWLRANIYNRSGRPKESDAEVTRAIDLGQVDAESYAFRGYVRLNEATASAAEADLGRAIELGRSDGWVFYWRARARQLQNELKGAEADLNEAIARGGVNAPAWFLRAGLRIDAGDPAGAEADAEAGLNASPEDSTGFTLRGAARLNLGRFAEADADLSRAIELGRDDFLVYRWRALTRLNLNRLEDAAADFSAAVHRGDQDPQTLMRRAGIRLALGQPGAAEQDLTVVIDAGADDADVRLQRGDSLRQQSQYARAVEDYSAAIAKGRDDARVYVLRGMCLREIGRLRESESDLDAALARDPGEMALLFQRALTRLQRGRSTEAEQDATSALERSTPEQSELRGTIFYVLGHCRYCDGDFAGALTHFDAALAQSPDDPGLRLVRVAALLGLERTAEAEADLPIVASRAKAGEGQLVAGLLALMREDFERARALFDEARKAAGDKDWHAWNGLASLLLGRAEDASSDYRRCSEEALPGDCKAAVVELDHWGSRFAASLRSTAQQTAMKDIRARLVQRIDDENS